MVLINTVRLVLLATPLLIGAQGQNRPAQAHPNPATPQNSKVHDKNWLKAQVRRRYGTSALPEKTNTNLVEKKTQPSDNSKQPPPKN